jgi:cytochrome c oxidase subunit III
VEHATPATTTHGANLIDSRKLGMWFFLGSEVIFFAALITAYATYRPLVEKPHIPIDIVAINTFLLLCSSYTMVRSLNAAQHDDQRGFKLFMLGTIVLGTVFVIIQGVEYNTLINHEGVTPSAGMFGTTFFGLTGFHGAHVVLGVIWLLIVLAKGMGGAYNSQNYLHVELAGLYWHFVDLVWVILFTLIYLIP